MNPKILFLLAFILPIWAGKAQNLVNQGTLKINAGTTLRIAGNLTKREFGNKLFVSY